MGDMDDIVKDFLIESYENLDQLDRHLVALEKEPTSRELLSAIFRTIHTIKGTCGFLGFGKLESVAHVGESLLSRLRDGHLQLNPELTTALLAMVDAIRQMLASIEATGQDGDGDYSELITTLTRLQEGKAGAQKLTAENKSPELEDPHLSSVSQFQTSEPQGQVLDSEALPIPAPSAPALGELLVKEGLADSTDIERALEQQEKGDTRKLGEILVNHGVM
ncbi:MAG: Hpt domain-containing protein [Candidatus Binatia bacterium]